MAAALASLDFIRDNRRGLLGVFVIIISGMVLALISIFLLAIEDEAEAPVEETKQS